MPSFSIVDLLENARDAKERYHEFARTADLSAGVYVLRTGEDDPQSPHTEDELYYVVSGRAKVKVGEEEYAVEAGSVVFVEANLEHRFHSIEEDLAVLVVFGPAEGSRNR